MNFHTKLLNDFQIFQKYFLRKCQNIFTIKNFQYFSMRFFLNHMYSSRRIRKTRFQSLLSKLKLFLDRVHFFGKMKWEGIWPTEFLWDGVRALSLSKDRFGKYQLELPVRYRYCITLHLHDLTQFFVKTRGVFRFKKLMLFSSYSLHL